MKKLPKCLDVFFAETYLPKSPVPVQVTHFGKPVAQGFVVFLQESWTIKTCTGARLETIMNQHIKRN